MTTEKTNELKKPEEWGKTYEGCHHIYRQFTDKLRKLISELLQENDIEVAQIEYRTKSVESFIEKIQREGRDYKNPIDEITDLAGIRVIGYYKEDVDTIGEIIKREFEVDRENSIDKSQVLDPDRFGYLSVHYVITLANFRKTLTEWKTFSNLKAEIQVRTVLQHAWAAIDHKLRYKTEEETPKNLRRQLFRLSALLELADEEFSNLKKLGKEVKAEYSKQVERGRLDIEIDLSSLEAYLELTKQHSKWKKTAEEVGFQPWHVGNAKRQQEMKSRLLRILGLIGITSIESLDGILKDASQWGKDALSRICEISRKEGFVPFATPYDVIIFLVLYAKKDALNSEIIKQTNFRPPLQKALMKVIRAK